MKEAEARAELAKQFHRDARLCPELLGDYQAEQEYIQERLRRLGYSNGSKEPKDHRQPDLSPFRAYETH